MHPDSDDDSQHGDSVCDDLDMFLFAIGETELAEQFKKNRVTLGQVLEFDEQDLINCGIDQVGPRKKILDCTAQMHCEKWTPTSLEELTRKGLQSSPGIYTALNDMNKHIDYIGVTLRYLRRCIQTDPKILELGKDYVGVKKVASELVDLSKTLQSTHRNIMALSRTIGKHCDDPLLQPANHIDEKYLKSVKTRGRIVPALLLIVVISMSIKLTKII